MINLAPQIILYSWNTNIMFADCIIKKEIERENRDVCV